MRQAFTICALLSASCAAASATGEPLVEIVVTATRTPTAVDRLAIPVIVIGRAEIERTAPLDAAELLSGRAGVEIARAGGPGQPASLFIRGTESNHTAVLVDGVRINPGTIGGAALQNILPESIERIEVVKGARSALWGSDAIGGVVNIITRASRVRQPEAVALTGRYDTQQLAFEAGAPLGAGASIGASLALQRSAGFAPLAGTAPARGYRNGSGALSLAVAPDGPWQLALQAWQAAGVSEYLGYDDNFRFGSLAQDFRNSALALSMTRASARTTWQTSVSNAVDVIDQREFADYAHTHRQALDTRLSTDLGMHQSLSAGAVFSREATASDSFGTHFDVQTRQQLYYLQDQLHLGQTEVLLATGLTQHQAFGAHHSWNAELNRALGARWRVTAAAGSAFHAPDGTDRFGYGGNPQLRPERSEQAELGLHWLPAAGQSLAVNAFDTRLRDLVTFELADPLTFTYQNRNIERARIRGMELSYQAAVGRWSVGAAATFQQPRNLSSGELLLRRARQHFDLRLGWQGARLGGFGALLYSGPRTDFNFPAPVQLPGYALLNLGASLQLSPSWLLQARLDNALDRDYQLVYGYNTPRRSAYLAARYRWR